MGHYTTAHFDVVLKKDAPEELIQFLHECLEENTDQYNHWCNIFTHIPSMESFNTPFYQMFPSFFRHPFFLTERWPSVIRGNTLEDEPEFCSITLNSAGMWRLVINCEIQNYQQSIDQFVNWIAPFVAGRKANKFIGCLREDGQKYNVNFYVVKRHIDGSHALFDRVEVRHVQ